MKSGSHSPSEGSSSPSAVGIALHCLITREKCTHHSSQLLGKIDAQMELWARVAEPVVYILDAGYHTPCILQRDFFFSGTSGSMSDLQKGKNVYSVF